MFALASSVAHAGKGSAALAHSTASTVSVAGLLLQMVIGLGVVLATIAVIARLLRGRGKLGLSLGRRQGTIDVLGRQTLGKGVSVALVRAGGRTFLLGVTGTTVRRISELSAGDLGGAPVHDTIAPLASAPVWPLRNDPGRTDAALPNTSQSTWTSTIDRIRDLTARRS